MIEGHKEAHRHEMEKIGLMSWYSGMASQLNFKKARFKKWMEQFKSKEEMAHLRAEELEEGKRIWLSSQKGSAQQQSK